MIFRKRGYRQSWKVLLFASLFFIFFGNSLVLAHGSADDEEMEEPLSSFTQPEGWLQQTQSLIKKLDAWALNIAAIAAVIVILLVVTAVRYEEQIQPYKKLFFLGIVIPIIVASLLLVSFTIYRNVISTTKGPVHWHADYEIWACGEKLDLIDPKGLSNRIGTSTFHEHGDDRIHVEGVVRSLQDVTLGRYFTTIGGKLDHHSLLYPTSQGLLFFSDGDACPDEQLGTLKVYANGKRIADPEHYIITQTAYVPPGDCIIVEFSPDTSDTTERLCASWAAKEWRYER